MQAEKRGGVWGAYCGSSVSNSTMIKSARSGRCISLQNPKYDVPVRRTEDTAKEVNTR